MTVSPQFSRRPSVLPLLAALPGVLLATGACGDTPQGGAAADVPAAAAAPDTATLSAEAAAIAEFTVDTARQQPWRAAVRAPARVMLDPAAVQTIGSITEGRIKEVRVRVGDRVAAGQVLVVIHSHEIMDARGALAQAEAHVRAATATHAQAVAAAERAARLLAAKAVAQAELERTEVARTVAAAALEGAQAEQARAEALVEHLVGEGPLPPGVDPHDVLIRAAAPGVVTARDAQPGTVVLPGVPLVTVGDPGRLQLQLALSSEAAAGVRAGSGVRYELTDAPGRWHGAVVTRVAPTVDTLTRTVEALARPTGPASGARAEAYAQAEVLGVAEAPVVVVPAAAVQAMDGDSVVIAVEPRGAGVFLRALPVRVGRRAGPLVELRGGVPAGTAVIVGRAAIAKAELLKRRGGGAAE
jgi:RND family efflux transporter MFP subunit